MATDSKIFDRHEFAVYLDSVKSEVLKKWEVLACAKLDAAKAQSRPALRDSLPQFLDHLVETLKSQNPPLKLQQSTDVAFEHAEDRAQQPEYTLDQVIAEYHLLRMVITDFIALEGLADTETQKIYHEFVDLSISKATVRYIEIENTQQNIQKAEIEAARADAERASNTKSAFLANMSHEIRTPLGAIMGFVGLIKDSKIEQDEDVANYLSIIDRNSHHLLRIIDDILDLTKVEAGKMAIESVEFNLTEFLADFASLCAMNAREKGIAFEFNSETKLPESIRSDPTRIRQILNNIVGNAIKFTEQGFVEVKAAYRENKLEFQVRDTGRGISQEQRTTLFQAFSQADSSTTRKFGGTGLGLVLTKKLSQALGGDFILVSSDLGKGSLFRAEFPVALPEQVKFVSLKSAKTETESLERDQINLDDLEILLVEDSPDNQYLVQKILEKTGANITIASEGSQGVEMALAGNFDVILMDIQMPVMDGHQAIFALRSKGYSKPVVALTAHAMKEEGERAAKSGFSYFLTKPIHRKSLLDLLMKIHGKS